MFQPLDSILPTGGRVSDRETVLALLNHNIALEHGAIVQYLQHAYAMGEGGIGTEVITIARAEMRHMKLFADLLVDLGGKPTLDRGSIYFEAPDAAGMMANGVRAEEDALREYRTQLERLDFAPMQRLLERVLADEEYHHGQFQGFEEELRAGVEQAKANAAFPSPGPVSNPEAMALVGRAFTEKYNQVLEVVTYYFESRDFLARDFLQESWTWAMRHMAHFADELSEHGADPAFTLAPTVVEGDLRAHVERAIALEKANVEARGQQLACPIPDDLKALLRNIRTHEAFNAEQLEILQRRLAQAPVVTRPSSAPSLPAAEASARPPVTEPPARAASAPPPWSSLTVGSLLQP